MSVSRRVIHHGLYFAVLGPLIGVLFLVLYIFFAKEPLVLLVIIQVLPLFLLLSITTGAIPALLTGVMVACLPEKIGSQKNYRCLAGGIGGGFAPIFPDTCYHLTHYWPAAADIPVASDNPVHYADAIRYNARTPLQGSLLPLTRLV